MRLRGWLLIGAGFSTLATTGCGDDGEPRSAVSTPPPTTPNVWHGEVNTLGLGAAPGFPVQLDGWQADDEEWTLTVRAFEDQWSPMSGREYADYPATMNGCDTALSLVRWRVVPKEIRVRASWQHATAAEGVAMGDALTGDRGWMILDGCQIPMFQVISPGEESYLADVAVTAKTYSPTA